MFFTECLSQNLKLGALMNSFAKVIMERTYAHTKKDGELESWDEIAYRVTKHVLRAVGIDMRQRHAQETYKLIKKRKFIPAGRYLYASGRPFHQTGNCFLLKAYDSREGWGELLNKASLALMSGGGIGVNYSDIRCEGSPIRKTGGSASGPISLMQMVNECGRGVMSGGDRRGAIWAGLKWNHPDIYKFIKIKNWPAEILDLKARNYSFPATLDFTSTGVCLDDIFFEAYSNHHHSQYSLAQSVYWATIEQMLRTGEPGLSVDIRENFGEVLRNACCELSSRDSDDVCCLGSINLAKVENLKDFKHTIDYGIAFLLAGTVYSDVPYSDVDKIRSKNRRLGLGLMGVHEWLLQRGKPYAPDEELGTWLQAYSKSGRNMNKWANEFNLSQSKKTRAIAPTGTTSIIAETTSGIEPLYCVSYKIRYLKGLQQCYQYVIDPVAKRLIDSGIKPESIEDAYSIEPEKRVAFQAWAQKYVDHCISSTVNLPAFGSELNNSKTVRGFGSMLMRYLPSLRGICIYPDGGRSGQPLVPVSYSEALKHEGSELIEESQDICSLKGGSCGD